MVLRAHRVADFMRCRHLAFNRYHRGYRQGEDWNLRDGTAVHAAIAHGRRTGDWSGAVEVAATSLATAFPIQFESDEWELRQHTSIVSRCIELYSAQWEKITQDVRVVAPELEFEIPLPNSLHSCVFKQWRDTIHNRLHTDMPTAELIQQGFVQRLSVGGELEPHYIAGRADSLIEWNGQLWLDEFKTTSITGERFWNEFMLDIQPTIYLYGVWKTLGVVPAGFILHQFYKPSEKQVEGYNKRRKDPSTVRELTDYIQYDRQLFTRDEEDLIRLEGQLIDVAEEWEWRVTRGKFPMSNTRGICTQWNRLCDFHAACLQHDRVGFEGLQKETDPERLRLFHIDGTNPSVVAS